MGIFSKIREITNCSHFSICQTEEDEIAIDLWDLNQTYKIDLKNGEVYFDVDHSDENINNINYIEKFLYFLEENKDDIM